MADSLPPLGPEVLSLARKRRVIVVGGGRGGVGKTLLTVNLGVYFAQLGREVVLCDADPFGSNLHAVLGLEKPPLASLDDIEEGRAPPVATSVPGLRLFPTAFDVLAGVPARRSRRTHWAAAIERLDVDYVLVSLGAATTAAALDLFLGADVGITVSTPEPPAVEATYGFVRALYMRALRRALMKERFRLRIAERTIASLPPRSTPPELVAALRKQDDVVGTAAEREMLGILARLVVSQTRLRSDLELGPAMTAVADRFLGLGIDYLGHIEHDDAVWLTVRRGRPLLIDSPTSKSARNLERVARRILALLAAREAHAHRDAGRPRSVRPVRAHGDETGLDPSRVSLAPSAPTLYETLGVPRTAADDEIRKAYKRQRETYREGSLPVVSVLGEAALKREQARIEEAYDTLLDPVRRRAYDLSTFPEEAPVSQSAGEQRSSAALAELSLLQAELAREIHADTQFTGPLLRKVRESQGVELAEIARQTKISTVHLEAIENERIADLPAPVYVQGFVQQIAKILRLDPVQVARTYARRVRELSGLPRSRGGGP